MDIGRKEFFANFGHGINDLILSIAKIWKANAKCGF